MMRKGLESEKVMNKYTNVTVSHHPDFYYISKKKEKNLESKKGFRPVSAIFPRCP